MMREVRQELVSENAMRKVWVLVISSFRVSEHTPIFLQTEQKRKVVTLVVLLIHLNSQCLNS